MRSPSECTGAHWRRRVASPPISSRVRRRPEAAATNVAAPPRPTSLAQGRKDPRTRRPGRPRLQARPRRSRTGSAQATFLNCWRSRAPGFGVERRLALRPRRSNLRTTRLVSPPVAPAIDVCARILTEVGRADDEDIEALWTGLVASPRAGRDAHRVPFLDLDDLLVDLHPPAPAQDHVHLLLLHVRVAVRKAIARRDALVAQTGFLELERLGRRAELQVRRAVELRADVLQIHLDVPERERHAATVLRHSGTLAQSSL